MKEAVADICNAASCFLMAYQCCLLQVLLNTFKFVELQDLLMFFLTL